MTKRVLSLIMCLSLLLCGCGGNKPAETTAPVTTAPVVTVESALAVLEDIWANYGEDEKFFVVGGNMENPVDGAPGNYDMAYAENLSWNLLVPAEPLASIDEAATMIHMMNANTFTCAAYAVADSQAFADAMKTAIQGNHWMCGFPEKLYIANVGNCLVVAYGNGELVNTFCGKLANATILYDEAIAG